MSTVLLQTVHGSHLYGLAHATSDIDTFRVTTKHDYGYPRRTGWHTPATYSAQTIVKDDDATTFDLPTFLTAAAKGVPQALEAMYSTLATIDVIAGLRASFYPDLRATLQTYRRAAAAHAHDGNATPKRVRHAYRLAENFTALALDGRFDPTLDADRIARLDHWTAQRLDPVTIIDRAYAPSRRTVLTTR